MTALLLDWASLSSCCRSGKASGELNRTQLLTGNVHDGPAAGLAPADMRARMGAPHQAQTGPSSQL